MSCLVRWFGLLLLSTVFLTACGGDSLFDGDSNDDDEVVNPIPSTPEIQVTPSTGLVTSENGDMAAFSVVLVTQPSEEVSITLSSSDSSEGMVSPTSLSFDSTNWSQAQTVTVTGIDDGAIDGNVAYTIVTAAAISMDINYNGLDASDVSATNTDNDVATPGAINVNPTSGLSTSEAGQTASFTVVLASKPTADVSIGLRSSDTTEGTVSPNAVNFTIDNWDTPQTVTVIGQDDAVIDGPINYMIITDAAVSQDASYQNLEASDVAVVNTDNDVQPIINQFSANPTAVEYGASATLSWMSNAEKCLASGSTADGQWQGVIAASGSKVLNNLISAGVNNFMLSCSIGNINSEVKSVAVTVAAKPNAPTVSLKADPMANIEYNGATVLTWTSTNADSCEASGGWLGNRAVNNQNGVRITQLIKDTSFTLTCSGKGGSSSSTVTVTVVSAKPELTFTAAPTSVEQGMATTLSWQSKDISSCSASANPANSAWTGAKAVSNAGGEKISNLQATTTFTLACKGINGVDVSKSIEVSVVPATPRTINVNPSSGLNTSEAGQTASFTVVLGAKPTANVTIGLRSSDTSEGTVNPNSVNFTVDNWNTPQSVTITGQNDDLVDGPISYMIVTDPAMSADNEYQGLNASDVTVINMDDDVQPVISQFTATPTSVEYGGSTALSWTSNAEKCVASGAMAAGQWQGDVTASGSKTLSNLVDSGTNTFMLTCFIGNINSQVKSVAVTVAAKPNAPTVSLSANPMANIPYNGNTVLTWTSTDADSCQASGGWSGNRAVNNQNGVSITNLIQDTSFTLACTGKGGSSSSTVAVTVVPAMPDLTFTASPTSIDQGMATTLSWQSKDISTCTASANPANPAWTGTKAVSNANGVSINNLQASTSFTLNCQAINGIDISKSVSVNVNIDTTPNPDRGMFLYNNAIPGSNYAISCAGCHGADGVAVIAPRDINVKPCEANRCADEATLATYLTAQMPVPGVCDVQCGKDIAAYMFRDIIKENGDQTEPVDNSAFYTGVNAMSDQDVMRKAAIMLAGRLPTSAELNTAGDRAQMRQALINMMNGPEFEKFVSETVNDKLLVTGAYFIGNLRDDDYPRLAEIEADTQRRNVLRDALRYEPLELVKHIVRNDRPYSEVITADYTMVNPESAYLYQATLLDPMPNGADAKTFVRARTGINMNGRMSGAYPHAGLLTQPSFLIKWPSTDTNRNRMRARVTSDLFLGVDLEALATRAIDVDSVKNELNPTLNNPNCTVCHNTVDPIAGAFQNWYNSGGSYRRRNIGGTFTNISYYYASNARDENGVKYYQSGDIWYRDMVAPGYPFSGTGLPTSRNNTSLRWLGERMTADTRFDSGTAKFWYQGLFGRKPLAAPVEPDPVQQAAYDAQTVVFNQAGQIFRNNNHNLKHLLAELVLSPWFRSGSVDLANAGRAELADLGTSRVLTPEQLDRKLTALLGKTWTRLIGDNNYYLMYGNFDARIETRENTRNTQISSLMAAMIDRMGAELSCEVVRDDFNRNAGQRLLFPSVSPNDTPANAEAAIRQNLVHLHARFLGKNLSVNDTEIDRTFNLLQQVRNAAQSDNTSAPCSSVTDNNFMKRSWMIMLTYFIGTYEFLYE